MILCDQVLLRVWLQSRIRMPFTPNARFIGNGYSNGIIRGVFAFDRWTGTMAEAHWAGSPGWLTKEFLRASHKYAIETCKLKKCFAMIPETNEKSMKEALRFGWEPQLVIPDGHESGPLCFMLYDLTKNTWYRSNK